MDVDGRPGSILSVVSTAACSFRSFRRFHGFVVSSILVPRPVSFLPFHTDPACTATTKTIIKDERDTPMRRVRHRDGRLLRGGIGLTTGLGWSDRWVLFLILGVDLGYVTGGENFTRAFTSRTTGDGRVFILDGVR